MIIIQGCALGSRTATRKAEQEMGFLLIQRDAGILVVPKREIQILEIRESEHKHTRKESH